MNAFFQSISRFFRRLFGLDNVPPEQRSPFSQKISGSPRSNVDIRSPAHPSEDRVTPKLRRLVYEVAYRLRQDKPTQGAQVGPVFRQIDPNFTARKYKFDKIFDLLEAVPSLVSTEKKAQAKGVSTQFIFYVRPVHDVRSLLTEAIARYPSEDGWIHEDSLKQAIAQTTPNFSVQTFGFSTFRTFIESRQDLLEFKESGSPYLRRLPEKTTVEKPRSPSKRPTPRPQKSSVPKPSKRKFNTHLVHFARLSEADLNQSITELAQLADDEPWYFGSQPPEDFPYPILRNYIRHTFTRLQHERKVVSSQDGRLYTFHTNLYDKLRRPIYALITQTNTTGRATFKLEFCVSGEGIGRNLVGKFDLLPAAANFMTEPENFFYYWEAGAPTVNWKHAIEDNMDRLPPEFLRQYLPAFHFRDTQAMNETELMEYKTQFNQFLEADDAAYREIVGQLEKALEFTLLRVQLNYKVAVPTYYSAHDRINLMLPLNLLDENKPDCVLVVNRERSGNYSGTTIFTMEQAYNNARLIYRPMQRWLVHPETLQSEEPEAID